MIYLRKFLLIIFCFSFSCCGAVNPNKFYIRLNQVGFLPNDIKTAVIIAEKPLFEKFFTVRKVSNNDKVFEKVISDSSMNYDKFKHCYSIDFSELKEEGDYYLEINKKKSYNFSVGNKVYNAVVDSLMLFFKVQRCGPTNPILHKVCHLWDAKYIKGMEKLGQVDLTGGWHDAGDYIKFLSTTAYTTYMLMFAYEFDPVKFGFDNNKNNEPDVLEEARVGLDWMLRSYFTVDNIVNQVQDNRDHNVGWRLPENDSLRYDRIAYLGMSKNQIGMFSAAMSLAARIWKMKFYDDEFSGKCILAAEKIYKLKDSAPDVDKNVSGVYQDKSFAGKLALGAVELYISTSNENYLKDAFTFANTAGSDYWWSWGDINSLAHYKLAKIDNKYKDYILNNIKAFNVKKDSSLFKESMGFSWGTTNSFLGAALQVILYKDLSQDDLFDSLATYQRDYVLGRNPWGISFIYNIGDKYVSRLHSQVGYIRNGYLPGGLSAGPAPLELLKNYKIERKNTEYDYFNTNQIKYYDDFNDYITNEPTIVGNATAVFVYGYYSNR